jgi:hypothetical protein
VTNGERQTDRYAFLWRSLNSARHDLELGDAVILIYIAAFVRQYFWAIDNNFMAWTLTILVSLLIWFVHFRTKEHEEGTPSQFWLVVALPLFLIYVMRAAFPDTSFDVLDYRLINAERALRSFPFLDGDFFPTRFPFNPAPDMVTGIFRHLLGYRLGTIINYLVVVWLGVILDRLLRPYIKSVWLRCMGVLFLLLTEHVLFLINNYMVDLLALPLLLEATRLALVNRGSKNGTRDTVRIALFLGASVAFKLTNLAFAAPILIVYAYKLVSVRFARKMPALRVHSASRQQLLKNSLLLAFAFIAPLLPFTLYIYWQTGNPVFPLFNKIFMSPFWSTGDFVGVRWGPVVDDPRWGSMKWWEVLLWPMLLPFKVEHTAADLGRHAGRISLCFIAAFVGLLLRTRESYARTLSLIVLFGAVLWSAISGMARYAIFLELAGGVVVLYLISLLHLRKNDAEGLRLFRQSLQALLISVMVVQSALACFYVYRFEWSSRPTFFEHSRSYARESKYFLRDYTLTGFLPPREANLIMPVQAWVESNALQSGIESLLKSDVPALCLYMPEYFSTEESKARFASTLRGLGNRRMFALSFAEHLEGSLTNIRNAGLGVGSIKALLVPYYSEHTRIQMVLIEVLTSEDARARAHVTITQSNNPLPNDAFRAGLGWSQPLPTFRAGLKETVYVRVRNVSNFVWPALGSGDTSYRLFLGNHWLDDNNAMVVNDDGRSALLYDLNPQEEIELPLTVIAPDNPGNYVLEVDMVQEGVTWFSLKGSQSLMSRIRVER